MKVPWAWFQVAFLARAGVSNGHFYGPRPACRGDRRSDHDFHGRRSADVYQRSRRDHHFRRVVCRHADPLPAVIDVSRLAAWRQIRLHHAAHDPARAGRRDCGPCRDRAQTGADRPGEGRDRGPFPGQGHSLCRRRLRCRVHPRQSRARPRQLPHPSRRRPEDLSRGRRL